MTISKRGVVTSSAGRRRNPDVLVLIEDFVLEVLVKKSDFPKLVCDIFSNVRHSAVGSNDDLIVLMAFGIESHNPTSGILARFLEKYRVLLTKLPERMVPKLEMQNVAFAGQQIV